ncbi:lysophospholipase L1-like esterase [Microbacterium sp. W4I4]|uniref:ricin-type beta-trefoil lectin domain protein n=1 Tax=Microbacterium sp. W4I4 TaxID=3042295 RepID=UPI0027876221|nr:ricin-type beta-trefoil lectin domain protein [Microbacterium sp. W4I4]MDQ0615367.1 lysophospholipase L1-like esterase [Microbacterium sp. W4I4]
MEGTYPHAVPVRRTAALAIAAALAFGGLVLTQPAPAAATEPGDVLYNPASQGHPDGSGGYPRAIRLDHDDSATENYLATVAAQDPAQPTELPVYRSVDGGESWAKISTLTSHTPGWDLEAPTLFEVPRDIPGLDAGDILAAGTAWDVGDYSAQKIEVFRSQDGGENWQYLSNCTQTSGLPDTWGHGIWEPVFMVAPDDTLACFISDERPAGTATNNQIIGHYISDDGGRTWSSDQTVDVAFPDDNLLRPGMQTFAALPDGRVAMSYELCRDATDPDHACETHIKFSDDGLDWGPLGERGTLVQTSDGRQLLHTPYISWLPGGGPNGTLLISGQRVVSGPTGDKLVLAESGMVLFANTNLGEGPWTEATAPVTVQPTGDYNESTPVPGCAGYSTPMIPRDDGTSYVYFAAQWLGTAEQCEVRFGIGALPGPTGQVVNQGPPAGPQRCLDVDTNTAVSGNAAQLWECSTATGQQWAFGEDGTVRAFGYCLDVDANRTANGSKVQLWDCIDGSQAQQWVVLPHGQLKNPQSGRCLDVPAGDNSNGTQLQIWDCLPGAWTQTWSMPVAVDDSGWRTVWTQSQQRVSTKAFGDQSIRMITRLAQGGEKLRIRLQNQFGDGPITMDQTTVALSAGGADIQSSTHHVLTFGGSEAVTLEPGTEAWSDPIAFETTDLADLAISFYFSDDVKMSLHDRAGRDNYGAPIGSGNSNAQASGGSYGEALPWTYMVSAVDVYDPALAGTIVAYGSSVVDGNGSERHADGTSAFGEYRRWTDDLARRVDAELPEAQQFAVVNEGIGGTAAAAVCAGGGLDGESRLGRDVLSLTGVTGLIYYYGTNDLAFGCDDAQIVAAMKSTFARLHDAGIEVYASPVTPRSSYTAQQNDYRDAVNEWVRAGGNCSGYCDAVLDFDTVLRDPSNSDAILAGYDAGDTIHANVEGQQAIADSIDLSVLRADAGGADAVASVVPSAQVEKLRGSKNRLTVTVTETRESGAVEKLTDRFEIAKNSTGTFDVGEYRVHIKTKGNTRVQEVTLVE